MLILKKFLLLTLIATTQVSYSNVFTQALPVTKSAQNWLVKWFNLQQPGGLSLDLPIGRMTKIFTRQHGENFVVLEFNRTDYFKDFQGQEFKYVMTTESLPSGATVLSQLSIKNLNPDNPTGKLTSLNFYAQNDGSLDLQVHFGSLEDVLSGRADLYSVFPTKGATRFEKFKTYRRGAHFEAIHFIDDSYKSEDSTHLGTLIFLERLTRQGHADLLIVRKIALKQEQKPGPVYGQLVAVRHLDGNKLPGIKFNDVMSAD